MGSARSKSDGPIHPSRPSGERPRVPTPETELELHDVEAELGLEENEIDASLQGLEIDLSVEQQQRISDVFVRLHVVDLYTLMGVPRAADTRQIKRAYNEWVSTLHPDRFFRKRLGTFKRKLDAIFIRLTEAHDTLCSPERRVLYDEQLRTSRQSVVDAMVEETLAEMAGSEESARRDTVDIDSSVRVAHEGASARRGAHTSGLRPAISVVSAEDIASFQKLHETRKRGGPLDPADRERYGVLREQFARAFVAQQQHDAQDGDAFRAVLRVPCAFRVTVTLGGLTHNTITLDLSVNGLAALVRSPLPVDARCELVLHVGPDAIRARARVGSSVKHGSGNSSFRVSLDFEPPDEAALDRLDVIVLDAALRRVAKSR